MTQIMVWDERGLQPQRFRDFRDEMAERLWNAAHPPSQRWHKITEKRKARFLTHSRELIAEIRAFKASSR